VTNETNDSQTEDETSGAPGESTSTASEGSEGVNVTEAIDPLEAAQAEALQLKDKLIRMAADFDNYRKRSRREVTDAEKKGRDGLLTDLLPVFDNLERATSHAEGGSEDPGKVKGLVDGIALVMRQFRDSLTRQGIVRVESVGKPFDPSVHEAIQHLETTDFPPGCIAAEVQPGYKEGDRLVRPAMVVVAKAPAGAPEPGASTGSSSADDGES
jgi:molecular chaperone GrpE